MINFLLLFLLFSTSALLAQPMESISDLRIVVIGVDGLSPDGIRNAETPVLDSLMESGSYTLKARAVLPTVSSPNWASMIMGASPAQHGITSNKWERNEHTLPPAYSGKYGTFPTIFEVIKDQKPAAISGAIYHWDGFGRLFPAESVNFNRNGEDQFSTTAYALDFLNTQQPIFTFIHLDHVDGAGHEFGHGTPEYYAAVSQADSLIGQIMNTLHQNDMAKQTVVLVTSDHGGINKGHGGETLAEIEIPFIVAGKGIRKNHQIAEQVYTFDNAATVAWLLGLKVPQAWIGRPVKSILQKDDSNLSISTDKTRDSLNTSFRNP
jgi:predicted AlkP superfamily pyrophosphatase or phosphodiesterase